MSNKLVLLAYLNGLPDVEALYPVLARLHQRNLVEVRALAAPKLLRNEPRLKEAFARHGLAPTSASKFRMKLNYRRDIRAADAVLSIADPRWDTAARRHRSAYIAKRGQTNIFLQHGAYQMGVNVPWTAAAMPYYSQKLLFWEGLGKDSALFEPETAARIETVGFTKQNLLAPFSQSVALKEWVARYPKRLLVCQSFRWGKGRYSSDHIDHFYAMMDDALSRHPDLGIIIRSHRGKVRKNHRAHDQALAAKHPNVLFSHFYNGPLAKASIHDAIELCDAMISPTSTTVLDCIYAGKRAAVFDEDLPLFAGLQQISDIASLEVFLNSIAAPDPSHAFVKARYGEIDHNLTRAAEAIERQMGCSS